MIKSLKFSHKILLAAALVVIATFSLFTLYNDSLQRTSIREDLEDYLHEMGEITASNVQNWLSGRILLIENLAQTLARDHSPETTQALLEQPLLGSTFLFTYLGQTDGTYTARPTSDLPADYDPRRRPWYNAATSAGQTTLTEPYMEPAIHELVLTIASPARQGGQPFGVVGGDLSLQTVVKIINSLDFGGMGYAFLVSGDGKILVHPDKDQVMKSLSDVYPRNTPKIGSGFSEAELHGNTRILSFSPVKGLSGLDWYIGISVDKDKAYAMLTKLRTSAIVAALIAVVAIVLLLGMLIRVLMQPLTDMGRAMQDIAQGEGDHQRHEDGDDEDIEHRPAPDPFDEAIHQDTLAGRHRLVPLHRIEQQGDAHQFESRNQDTGDEHHHGDGEHVGMHQFDHALHDGGGHSAAEEVDRHDRQQVGGYVEDRRGDQQRPGAREAVWAPGVQHRTAAAATRMLVPVGAIQLVALAAHQNSGIKRAHRRPRRPALPIPGAATW